MSGLIGTGIDYRSQAETLASQVAQEDQERRYQNMQITAAQKQKQGQNAGLGAVMGYSAGAGSAAMGAEFGGFAGPIGALAGAGIGLLVGRLF